MSHMSKASLEQRAVVGLLRWQALADLPILDHLPKQMMQHDHHGGSHYQMVGNTRCNPYHCLKQHLGLDRQALW